MRITTWEITTGDVKSTLKLADEAYEDLGDMCFTQCAVCLNKEIKAAEDARKQRERQDASYKLLRERLGYKDPEPEPVVINIPDKRESSFSLGRRRSSDNGFGTASAIAIAGAYTAAIAGGGC